MRESDWRDFNRDPEPEPYARPLREAYDAAIMASEHVESVDAALVEAGRTIADRVDDAVANGEGQEITKALYLLPHMTNVLRELLATPASRQAVKAKADEAGGKLGALRAIHDKGRAG